MENKQAILKKFLDQGVLLSPQELEDATKTTTQTTKLKTKITPKNIIEYKNRKYNNIQKLYNRKILVTLQLEWAFNLDKK